jgi:hypothetical protein
MAYTHVDLFPLGEDTTPYRKLGSEGVSVEKIGDREVLSVSREARSSTIPRRPRTTSSSPMIS